VPRAKTGGLPRCCPVLCGLGDRCIVQCLQPLMAVRKDRDARAELNRGGQACEVLADTGISRCVKWSERRVLASAKNSGGWFVGQHPDVITK